MTQVPNVGPRKFDSMESLIAAFDMVAIDKGSYKLVPKGSEPDKALPEEQMRAAMVTLAQSQADAEALKQANPIAVRKARQRIAEDQRRAGQGTVAALQFGNLRINLR